MNLLCLHSDLVFLQYIILTRNVSSLPATDDRIYVDLNLLFQVAMFIDDVTNFQGITVLGYLQLNKGNFLGVNCITVI